MYRKIDNVFDINVILENLKNEDYVVCLDSQNDDRTLSRYTIISCNPIETFNETSTNIKTLSMFDDLYNTEHNYDFLPFNGGFIGALSYHLLEEIFDIKLENQNKLPKIIGGVYNQAIIIDHQLSCTHLFNHEGDISLLEAAVEMNNQQVNECTRCTSKIKLDITKSKYDEAIAKTKNYIAAGDVYEINLTTNYLGTTTYNSNELFRRLKASNPAPFAALLNFDDINIISTSPELFFKIENNKIMTQPMKGTAKRTNDPIINERNLKELKKSIKDRSELVMIIDLMRNDLSKVCIPESVLVENQFMIKEYPTVFQQVCDVVGTIKPQTNFSTILKALFPSGSITGAPKLRSIEVIDELENYSREYYTGSIGYISYNQKTCLSVAIRTIIKQNKNLNFSVGGAIVWDSTADGEFEEVKVKAKAMYDSCQ